MAFDAIKKALGTAAAEKIQDGSVVGLGSGSTVAYFIEALGERTRHGLNVKGCPTSQISSRLAIQSKIPLIAINRIDKIDIAVDGADQVNKDKQMIKGRGAALLREKIVLTAALDRIILIDASKKVVKLGDCLLPVEVVPIADLWIIKQIEKLGFLATVRQKGNGVPVVTDNQNHIIDIELKGPVNKPEDLEKELKKIPGIVETGLFFNLANTVLVGNEQGVDVWS